MSLDKRSELIRFLKAAIERGGNLSLRVVRTTRWQRQKGDALLELIMGKKRYEERTYFPPPPEGAEEIARWDLGRFGVAKWG